MDDISKLMTEQVNDRSKDIETQSIGEILRYMNDENRKITDAIEQCIPEIEKVTAGVVQAFEKGGRLIYLGAGDFWSTWCSGRKRCAHNIRCITGDGSGTDCRWRLRSSKTPLKVPKTMKP